MKFIRWFSEISVDQLALVGGKNASLGELVSSLGSKGIKVPDGFAITADAYDHYLAHNDLAARIRDLLDKLIPDDLGLLTSTGARVRQWIMHAELPKDLSDEIGAAYEQLATRYGPDPDVAVRSSATAEDLPDASFAGQQETYLNIRGSTNLLASCKRVFASLFTDRAISYRMHQGYADRRVALSIGVQKMIRADKGAAGVMFSLDTETGFRDVVFISAAYGLGESVVQGTVNPDEFYVFKPTLASGHRPIVRRHLGRKSSKMIYTEDSVAGLSTQTVHVRHEDRECFAITDDDILELARYAVLIEQHYSQREGHYVPMDIEWAKDGEDGNLYILQARPETVQIHRDINIYEQYRLLQRGHVLTSGKSVGNKIATGKSHVIHDAGDMAELQPGEILVTDITDPDWEPVMKTATAIVTNRGGRTCHAAIVARELGTPAVVGCNDATEVIRTGGEITVSCAEGSTGNVYEGILRFERNRVELTETDRPKTKLMLNLGDP
ncbi:MAG: phosphoenolpyruvate synthase, partial [Gammaproteobacteria bacterium]|nr:phosphoenolpyruvate synthase [Gammaproteobacteria bacterium]